VFKISTREERGETIVYHHLELLAVAELAALQRSEDLYP
jgi:hypothetical protein